MHPVLDRLRIQARDTARYSPWSRAAAGALHLGRSLLSRNPAVSLEHAVRAYQFSSRAPVKSSALKRICRHLRGPGEEGGEDLRTTWRQDQVGWERLRQATGGDPAITRTIIVKAPGDDGEKGVLLTTFEYNWLRLLQSPPDAIAKLDEQFDIIFSTSSSPTSIAALGLALTSLDQDILVQPCNRGDVGEIEGLDPRVRCLPTLPCDWLEPSFYEQIPVDLRTRDIVMVAGWGPVKRHWQFFRALSKLSPDLKVTLIGQADGSYTAESIRELAKLFHAPQDLEIHQSLDIEEVGAIQFDSRVSLIFSRREGCCVAVAESLIAGTPVGLMADAYIGPKEYINPDTGVLLDRRRDLSRQIAEFVDAADTYSPREWAEERLSCHTSAQKLESFLKEHAERHGRPWTRGILTPCWRPHPTVRHHPDGESLRDAFRDLHRLAPDTFPAGLFLSSHR